MSAGLSASFCLIVCFLVCSSEAEGNITAEHGEDVTLRCIAGIKNEPITAVQWSRPGLDPEYVLLYRNRRFNTDVQHPSYKNRVDLKDREMKDGDASMILMNVTKEDEGTYKCRVIQTDTDENYIYIIRIFNLEVLSPGYTEKHEDRGDEDGNTGDGGNTAGIIAGSVVVVLILLAGLAPVVFLIYNKLKKKSHSPVPPDEAAGKQIEMTVSGSASDKCAPKLCMVESDGSFWMEGSIRGDQNHR